MNSAEEISKYSDNNSHYRSPTLARRAAVEVKDTIHEKPVKKDKKWSLGGLFRRRKKEVESESSSDEDASPKRGFLQRRKQKKEDKRKKRSNKTVGHFDHIVVTPNTQGNKPATNGVREQDESGGILSEPCVRLSYGNNSLKTTESTEKISSRESLNKNRPELNLSRNSLQESLDSTSKRIRKEKVKARVEALRDRLKNDSSSDEGSQKSTTSSVTKFKSDDSLGKRDNTNRKSRSARTERYIRRLTKEDENVLNKEAEMEKKISDKLELDNNHEVQVNRWVVVDELPKFTVNRKQFSSGHSSIVSLPQTSYVSTIPPSHFVHRTHSNLSDRPRNYFNSSHKPTMTYYNALKNSNNIANNVQRSQSNSFTEQRYNFQPEQRSSSYDCNINRCQTPVTEENVIHVQLPLGKPIPKLRNPSLIGNIQYVTNQNLNRITPPPPPPRDPQRKLLSNVQYENCRPTSYAFESRNPQQIAVDRSSSVRSFNMPPPTAQNLNRAQSFAWHSNYRSNSEDHINQSNNSFNSQNITNRPASATPDVPQQRFIRRHPTTEQYKYFADKTPRSRKPIIHVAAAQSPEQSCFSDSQVNNQCYSNAQEPVQSASEFWKKKDMELAKRKSQNIDTLPEKKLGSIPRSHDEKSSKTRFSVISVPVKTIDSLSSLSGHSDVSPVCSKPVNDQSSDTSKSKLLAPEKVDSQELKNSLKVRNDPPDPPTRRYSRQSSASSSENWLNDSEEKEPPKRRSSNLEDALDELEAIYKSLRLGDEDLLDRAERRDVPVAVTQKLLTKMPEPYTNWSTSRGAQSDSGYNYDNVDGLRKKYLRRSCIPDKINDDMAYRRLNRDRPPPLDINATVSQVSYLLASPVLGNSSVDENENEASNNNKEPDITLDDVVYRNVKHANNTLKIPDPQPLFGIPVGPVTGSANSDYLHAVPENRPRPRFIPQKSPDIVKDDLAYRSLRKDSQNNNSVTSDDYLNNNRTRLDQSSKKKRAVRSISANIYNLMHKDIKKPDSLSENEFDKTQSLTDIADAMEIARQILKDRQDKIFRKSASSDTETKTIQPNLTINNVPTSTETLTESKNNLLNEVPAKDRDLQQKLQVYIPLSADEVNLNQKPPPCPTPDKKSSRPPTKESTPNRVSPTPEETHLNKIHLDDLLTALAIEARETSEKLGNDLKLLDEEESKISKPEITDTDTYVQDEKATVVKKSIDQTLSVIDEVSKHAKMCERLLGSVVESTDLIQPKISELSAINEPDVVEEVSDLFNEPIIYKSVANVIVTRKPEMLSPATVKSEINSESDHDYANISKKDSNTLSSEELKNDENSVTVQLSSDEMSVEEKDYLENELMIPVAENGACGNLQGESCSEGETFSAIEYLACHSPIAEYVLSNNTTSPSELQPVFEFPLSFNFSDISDPLIFKDDPEHSSGFHTESRSSSSTDSSLNPVGNNSDLEKRVLFVNSHLTSGTEYRERNLDNRTSEVFLSEMERESEMETSNSVVINQNPEETEDCFKNNKFEICSNVISRNISKEFRSVVDQIPPSNISSYTNTVNKSNDIDQLDNLNISRNKVEKEFSNGCSLSDGNSLITPSQMPSNSSHDFSKPARNIDIRLACYNNSEFRSDYEDRSPAHSRDNAEEIRSAPMLWYRDPSTLALACSYGLAFVHQLAFLDIFTLLALILAIITVFAALVL